MKWHALRAFVYVFSLLDVATREKISDSCPFLLVNERKVGLRNTNIYFQYVKQSATLIPIKDNEVFPHSMWPVL